MQNKLYTRALQKGILIVLIFKTLNPAFVAGSQLFCINSDDEAYWGLATTSTFTLYNTFVYTLLALMSRGYCLLRENLSRSEVTSIAVIMGGVYLGFSAYLIQPDDMAPVLLVIIGLLFFSSSKCSVRNIKILQIRFYNLQRANIRPVLPEISQKIWMMKCFLWLSYVFYMNDVVNFTLVCIGETLGLDYAGGFWKYVYMVDQVLVCASLMSIFVIFRSKSRPAGMEQSIIEEAQLQPVALILIARIPDSDVIPGEHACLAVFQQNIHGKR